YASVMEHTCKENQAQNANTPPKDCYNPILSKGKPVKFEPELEGVRAEVLNAVFSYWHSDPKGVTGNAFIDTINAIFGTQGLFDMCNNANVHPLAQLSTLGKGLVEAAIRNLGFALGTGVAGILVPYIGPALGAASSFFVTVASIGILIGFMLYYIVPFMPFLYFLFAVGGWVKGIFEAMVGVPLWALAHLRIDGQGLPGDGAINGYFLIFEIFIRPILIVFGLLASILIFGAMVKVLNEIFSLVVTNLSGNDPNLSTSCGGGSPTPVQQQMQANTATYFRGPIDEFFYTIVYAILVYMIGMSSFKLIDLIPNNILRWMGQGVHTFGDQAGEPAEGLMTKMAVGGSVMGGQLQGIGSAAGQMGGNLAAAAKNLAS
ncbi:MAG TPA: DotA/TraY family protein, partial [Alphaproteobacteria bacterium]|nr:DotA/TraY family protein [Alphaproteobacteria bacterium]